jgi:hypothetical protein
MWLFYAPVAAWTLLLAIRYRGFRTITAANPGIADGGVVGESKQAILTRLPEEWTLPSFLIPPSSIEERVWRLLQQMSERGWRPPLVLKPDVGQRGAGVKLVSTIADARMYLERQTGSVVAQPYHPGPFEAGIFYYRRPDEARGRILSITDKHFPLVTGGSRPATWTSRTSSAPCARCCGAPPCTSATSRPSIWNAARCGAPMDSNLTFMSCITTISCSRWVRS